MESPSPFCLCKCQNTCIFLFLNFVILLFNIPSKLGMAPNRQLPINSVPYFLSIKNKQSVYQLLNYICESVDALCQVFVLSIINQKKIFINLHLQFQTFSWAPDKYLLCVYTVHTDIPQVLQILFQIKLTTPFPCLLQPPSPRNSSSGGVLVDFF